MRLEYGLEMKHVKIVYCSERLKSLTLVTAEQKSTLDPLDPDGEKPDRLDGHIEFCDVGFSYPSRPDVQVSGILVAILQCERNSGASRPR